MAGLVVRDGLATEVIAARQGTNRDSLADLLLEHGTLGKATNGALFLHFQPRFSANWLVFSRQFAQLGH